MSSPAYAIGWRDGCEATFSKAAARLADLSYFDGSNHDQAYYQAVYDYMRGASDAAAGIAPEGYSLAMLPANRPKKAKFTDQPVRQTMLLSGLDCLAGQQDLFATDGEKESR